jgi:hypothetical protein
MPGRRRAGEPTLALGNRDPKIEQMLRDQFKVDYTFLSGVSTTQINMERSRTNNARFEALNEGAKKAYVAALKRGDVFPPIIAYRGNRGTAKKLTVGDGNHRVAAHHEVGVPLDVYELDPATPAATITMITMVCNTKNGLPLTPDERIDHAVSLTDNKVSHKDAAEMMGITENKLRTALHVREADKRANAAGIDVRVWEGLTKSARARLNGITTDGVLKEAATLAHDARFNTVEVNAVVTELRTMTDVAKQREFLKTQRAVHKERIGATAGGLVSSRAQTPKHRMALVMGHFTTLTEDPDAITNLYKGEEREELADKLEVVSLGIINLLKTLRNEDE